MTATPTSRDETLDITFERMTPQQVRKWLARIVIAGATCTLLTFFVYYYKFGKGGASLSSEQEDWARFGEFVGGTAGPMLGFLTMLGIVLTLVLQVRQLEDSREQLKASQAELERSRELQMTMATAMGEQARYATISARVAALNASLSIVTNQVEALRGGSESGPGGPRRDEFVRAAGQQYRLSTELLGLTDELLGGFREG